MKRIVYVLAAALVVAAAGVVYRTYRGGSVEPGLAGEPSPAGRGPARVLLNEILFAPPEGQPQWVELVNVGGDAVALDGFALENHAREVYALPGSITMPAGSTTNPSGHPQPLVSPVDICPVDSGCEGPLGCSFHAS